MFVKVAGEGGYDFSPFLVEDGYSILESEQIELKRTPIASGYDSRKLAEGTMIEIELRFRAGISDDDVSDILTAFHVDTNILLEYWSKEYKRMRLCYFEVAKYPVGTLAKIGGVLIHDEFRVMLRARSRSTEITPIEVTKYAGTVTDKQGGWANEANIQDDLETYATSAGVLNTNQQIVASNFGFEIPLTAIIVSVAITVCYKASTAASAFDFYMAAAYKGTFRGGSKTTREESLADKIWTSEATGNWTPAALNDAGAEVYAGFKRTSSVACTMSIRYITMTVKYKEVV